MRYDGGRCGRGIVEMITELHAGLKSCSGKFIPKFYGDRIICHKRDALRKR